MSNQTTKPNLDIIHNQAAKRFETTIDGQTGYISYQDREAKPAIKGGLGRFLPPVVRQALSYAW